MAPVSTSDITSRLAGLSIQSEKKVVEHAAAKSPKEWRDALEGKSEGDLVLTKTVSGFVESSETFRGAVGRESMSSAFRGKRRPSASVSAFVSSRPL